MATLADKSGILGQLWIEFREDPDFKNFVEYNDIGLPMAYMMAQGLVKEATPLGEQYIEETFDMLIGLLKVEEEEVDELEEIELGFLLQFAFNKKKTSEDTPDL